MLIVLCGLPGTGKTTIARLLAQRLSAVHLRIDTIEQALLGAGAAAPLGADGYLVAYGVASDNLRLGLTVVADAVNANSVPRTAWESVAHGCGARFLLVHLSCSDSGEHRRRVLERRSDIAGQVLPTWEAIAAQVFESAPDCALSIDTCSCAPEEAVELIMRVLG